MSSRSRTPIPTATEGDSRYPASASLSNLPPELIHQLFDALRTHHSSGYEELIHLANTNKTFRNHVKQHLFQLSKDFGCNFSPLGFSHAYQTARFPHEVISKSVSGTQEFLVQHDSIDKMFLDLEKETKDLTLLLRMHEKLGFPKPIHLHFIIHDYGKSWKTYNQLFKQSSRLAVSLKLEHPIIQRVCQSLGARHGDKLSILKACSYATYHTEKDLHLQIKKYFPKLTQLSLDMAYSVEATGGTNISTSLKAYTSEYLLCLELFVSENVLSHLNLSLCPKIRTLILRPRVGHYDVVIGGSSLDDQDQASWTELSENVIKTANPATQDKLQIIFLLSQLNFPEHYGAYYKSTPKQAEKSKLFTPHRICQIRYPPDCNHIIGELHDASAHDPQSQNIGLSQSMAALETHSVPKIIFLESRQHLHLLLSLEHYIHARHLEETTCRRCLGLPEKSRL